MFRYIRLTEIQISDCCGSVAEVKDTKEDHTFCLECWGKKLQEEHPEFIKSNEQKSQIV